ncbi:MAG: SRPBCC family protein [Bacteroides sp.]
MTTFESEVRILPYNQERVYTKLSNPSNLEDMKKRFPEEKMRNLCFDENAISLNVPVLGQLTLQIIEREPFKKIKFETINSPVPFCFWIELDSSVGKEECKIKAFISVELNPLMKGMVQKTINDTLKSFVDLLTIIEY